MKTINATGYPEPQTEVQTPYGRVLRTTPVLVHRKTEEGEWDEYTWTEYRLTTQEYDEVLKGYEGDVPLLRIAYLKQCLTDTDYAVVKIAEADTAEEQAALRIKYADVIASRKAWRQEIDDLRDRYGI